MLDTIAIKQPGLLHDTTTTVKNPHNTRKRPQLLTKRGVSQHVKAGATAAADDVLYRLLEVDGGFTAVVDGGREIAGESAKGFLKSVLHARIPGLGAAVDATEAASKSEWCVVRLLRTFQGVGRGLPCPRLWRSPIIWSQLHKQAGGCAWAYILTARP